jgi:hypothetical protein
MKKLFLTINILVLLLPLTAVASNKNDDLSFFESNNNLIIALDNKTNTALSIRKLIQSLRCLALSLLIPEWSGLLTGGEN